MRYYSVFTSNSGALLRREALDNGAVIETLEDNRVDPRHPLRIRHSLASQLRTLALQRTMGWIDLSDTDTLCRDPLWQLVCSDAGGTTPLTQDRLSQAMLSHLLTCPGRGCASRRHHRRHRERGGVLTGLTGHDTEGVGDRCVTPRSTAPYRPPGLVLYGCLLRVVQRRAVPSLQPVSVAPAALG